MPCAPQWIDVEALLSRVSLFAGMPPQGLARLADATREIHANRHETLFRKNDPCNGLYLLVYGRVKLAFSSSLGDEKILDLFDQGDVFCEATMFLGRNYQVYAQTLSECLLMHVAKTGIMGEMERDPALARQVIDSLAQRLFDRAAEIESYSMHSGRQRVIRYLLREPQGPRMPDPDEASAEESAPPGRHVARADGQTVITLMTRKSDLASRLNLSQEHFSRILHELAECGLIFVDGRDIYIRDVEQLRIAAG